MEVYRLTKRGARRSFQSKEGMKNKLKVQDAKKKKREPKKTQSGSTRTLISLLLKKRKTKFLFLHSRLKPKPSITIINVAPILAGQGRRQRCRPPLTGVTSLSPSPTREIVLWPTKNQLPRDLRQPKSLSATSFTTGAITVDAGSHPFSPSLSRDRRPR